MTKQLIINERELIYNLEYKAVKNINLRIKSDGSVHVSANRWVSQKSVESFIVSRADFIFRAIDKFKNKPKKENIQYFDESEIRNVITQLCKKLYPCYEKRGVAFPTIKFRKMVSQWGNCRCREGILTFNINLMYAPIECIEYVVHHEFTHFIEANHSAQFYRELEKSCPDWKASRKKLKEINLR